MYSVFNVYMSHCVVRVTHARRNLGEWLGRLGIRPNNIFVATLTPFQLEWVGYAHHVWTSQPTFKPFRRACDW